MRLLIVLSCGVFLASGAFAETPLVERVWKVDGVERKALLYIPPTATTAPGGAAVSPSPVIFAFHGHGGTAAGAARSFDYQALWPEAACVYMQGLPTAGKTDPEGKKPGWQMTAGATEDRDLKFFDAVWASVQADYKVDTKRVFVTGHSNGGMFTYLLWAERSDVIAAAAPMAAVALPQVLPKLTPKPALHMAGRKDAIVPYDYQERTMEAVRKLDGCAADGQPWESTGEVAGTKYVSAAGMTFVSLIHPGPHKFPAEVPGMIVKFFKSLEK